MSFYLAHCSDVGNYKSTNQDSYCIKAANTAEYGEILMCVVCDGMGGLQKGELASGTVVNEFGLWFENSLPIFVAGKKIDFELIKKEWNKLILSVNAKIGNYGIDNGISLGTTLVALLFIDGKAYITNVGDSRIYKIDGKLNRLTHDHSLVAREIEQGLLSPDQEETDPRRNVLLQCIGASTVVTPDYDVIQTKKDDIYLLCSDGFRHEVKEEELLGVLSANLIDSQQTLQKTIEDIVELDKTRDEHDNITAVAFMVK